MRFVDVERGLLNKDSFPVEKGYLNVGGRFGQVLHSRNWQFERREESPDVLTGDMVVWTH
jgi:hypothetical protein